MFINREWATPLVIGAFLLSGLTGLALFLGVSTFFGTTAHEYLGLVFIVGGLSHLTVNFPAFKRHLKQTKARIIIGLYVLVVIASFLPIGPKRGDEAGFRNFIQAALAAPLTDVARVIHRDPNEMVQQLQAAGYAINDPSQSIMSATAGDPKQQLRAIGAIDLLMSKKAP